MTRLLSHRQHWLCGLLAALPLSAAADAVYRHFDLPSQALQSGLVELALQADVTVIANHQLIRGYQSSPLIGPHTAEQALKKLLSRTPLDYRYDAATGTFVILPRQAALAEPPAEEQSPAPARLEEVVVYAPSYPFRYNTLANTQLDGGTAVYDNSRFHTVLPAPLIADLMPLEIADLLHNGSGISPADGRADTNDDFYMRGFPRHALYLDGFRVENTTGGRFLPDNIERVEILKGPSTIRYGQGEPGGMVNLVRKKPLDEALAQMQMTLGNNGLRKIAADVSDQWIDDTLSYRVNAVDVRQDRSADIHDLRQHLLAPSLRWRPDTSTDTHIHYEWQQTQQRTADDFPLAHPDDEVALPGLTLDRLVRRQSPYFKANRHLLQMGGQRFFAAENEDTGWRLSGHFVWQEERRAGVRGTSDYMNSDLLFRREEADNLYMLLVPGGQVLIPVLQRPNHSNPFDPVIYIGTVRSIYHETSAETGLQSALELDGTVAVGGLQHHLNLGVSWNRQDLFQSFTVESRWPLPLESWPESLSPSLDYLISVIFDPQRPLGALERFSYRQVSDEYGVYAQDTVEVTEKLSITAGARLSRIAVERDNIHAQTFEDFQPVQKIRVQSGLNYQLTDDVQLFGNYAQGLRSNQSQRGFGNTVSEPELSDQWEFGIKGYFLQGRLAAALAGYQINKTNIYWLNPVAINALSLQEYGQRVTGMDLDFTYQMSRRSQLMGSFSAQDNELTYGPYQGNVPAASTPNTASFFWRQQLSDALAVNIGGQYVGQRYADHANVYKVEAFFLLDAGAQYELNAAGKRVGLQLKLKNLLDEHYYSDMVAGVRFNEGARRQIIAGMNIAF
jgi:iron complex outermembrane receptor protein